MPITDTDWKYLEAFIDGLLMTNLLIAEALCQKDVLDRRELIDRVSHLSQARDPKDPRGAVVQKFLKELAEGAAAKTYPKHPGRGPRRR